MDAAKRIIWILNQQFKIEFSPLIPIILSLLLIFLHEDEAFVVMKSLINRSTNTNTSTEIRWHFTTKKVEFGR